MFNEDRLLMDLRFIQKELQQMLCPKHSQMPDVSILGDRLHIRCCCEEFRGEVMRKSESLMYHALRDDIAKDIMRIMMGERVEDYHGWLWNTVARVLLQTKYAC